jgi:hypothetical protein
MGYRQVSKPLGEGFTSTSSIDAEKSTHLNTKHNGIVHQGDICQGASIATMNLPRFLSTVRTGTHWRFSANGQQEDLAFTGDLLKQQVRTRREQQGG